MYDSLMVANIDWIFFGVQISVVHVQMIVVVVDFVVAVVHLLYYHQLWIHYHYSIWMMVNHPIDDRNFV